MTKLAIIHYMPLEYYPPVTNFINTLVNDPSKNFYSIRIYSSKNTRSRKAYQINQIRQKPLNTNTIKINRTPFPRTQDKVVLRIVKYAFFNLYSLVGLLKQRPNNILYYESYSAWPAYIYTHFFNRRCRIFIHNHEYADKNWYATTMKQVKYYHLLEKKWLYPRAVWISQTNNDRLQFFHNDHPTLNPESLRTMPNYPPCSWKSQFEIQKTNIQNNKIQTTSILSIVYVGSLSFQSTYIKEFCDWVIQQNGKVQFDIYGYNIHSGVKEYLSSKKFWNINYYEKGVEYNEMPLILAHYQVGVILYKAHNTNYTFNAPNKLFEYLACDLDVLYPSSLEGPKAYNTLNSYPQVIPVNFENLDQFNWKAAIDKKEKIYKPTDYYCEHVYSKLLKEITKG